MKLKLKAGLLYLIVATAVAVAAINSSLPKVEAQTVTHDPRIGKLNEFFRSYKCPYHDTQTYLQIADKYKIDYRLLPTLSVVESSCGRHFLYNNLFGWGSSTGLRHFKTMAEGADFVGSQLAQGNYYRGKTLEQKLRIYNSVNPNYTANVKRLMKQID